MNKEISYFKKALVMLMAVMMVFTMMPSMAWAETEDASVSAKAQLSQLMFQEPTTKQAYEMTPDFNPETKAYRLIVPDNKQSITAYATLKDASSQKIIKAKYKDKRNGDKDITVAATGTMLNAILNKNLKGTVVTVTVGDVEAYTVTIVRKATLKTLEMKNQGGEPITLTPAFNGNTNEYQAEVEADDALTVKAASTATGAVIKVGEQEMKAEGVLVTLEWNNHTADITITAGDPEGTDAVSGSYTIHLIQAIQSLEIKTPPTKCNYNIGEKFNVTGLEVQAVYADGTKQTIPNDELTIKPNADDILGLNTSEITISYGAKSVSQQITVKSKLQGEGTQESPYQLASENNFNTLRAEVAAGESFAGKHFKIMQDITFSQGWEPIGCLKEGTTDAQNGVNIMPFSGEIDGNAKTLTFANGSKPLFNYVRGASVHNFNIVAPFMDGYALVDKYTVDYGEDGKYSEGTGGSYEPGTPDTIEIANVTLKSGSIIKKGGFIGGFASGSNTVIMTNCTVEKGVKIGCNADGTSANDSQVGSFAGMVSGIFKNCVSYADVYGKDRVGGIVGYKGQSMGLFDVSNCRFEGNVYATEDYAGGIVGAGYSSPSAPNTMCTVIKSCKVTGTVNGRDYVGGILGAESAIQCWDNGIGEIQNNSFEGKIIASGQNVGGIIGYMGSLNRYTKVMNNYYQKGCGANDGIGKVQYVDTSDTKHETKSGAVYFDTSKSLPQVNGVEKLNHNRTDDPLGADKAKLCSTTKREGKYIIELQASGQCRTHYVNEALDLTGITLTAVWSDDTQTSVSLDDTDLKIIGYKPSKHGQQSVTLSYQGAEAEISVTVLYTNPQSISVTVSLLGDSDHGDSDATKVHGLAMGGLTPWIDKAKISLGINTNNTVWDALQKLSGVKWINPSGNYISSVTYNGITIAEFTNGKNSGWMYALNGTHPLLGVSEQYLKDEDVIVFHYTDDYTKEEGSDKWNTPGAAVIEEVKDVTTDTKTGTTTAPTEVKVTEKANADGTKSKVAEVKVSADNQKEILKQAKANKSKEIILSVATKAVGDATKADVTLDKSFIDSIVKDTDAKLTVKTPFGDKTYTQDELKTLSAAATGNAVTIALEKAAEEPEVDAAALTAKLTPVARSAKTAKKNVKVTVNMDKQDKEIISQLKDAGYTVKYRFYRSTKKSAGYKSTVTKKTATYTNTSGKKGTKYFYKVQVRVYDENGKLVAKTALKQCKYASRTWTKK